MFRNILVLCTANICRSPLAEGLLKLKLEDRPDIQVHSAGVAALTGVSAHPIVLDMLRKAGSNMRAHRARQCDLELLRQADLVLVMEQSHLKWLSSAYPQFHGRSFLMGHWEGKKEVPDPIGQPREVFESVRGQIDAHADEWLAKILKPGPARV
jgi:protein-tyrosine phosphatase